MNKILTTVAISVMIAFAITGCKKSSNDATSVTQPFKADTAFTLIQSNAFPNYDGWNSIAMDTIGNKIFFYYSDATDGFRIDLLDVATGTVATIYKHFSQSGLTTWEHSNGSECMRLRYFPNTFDGNKLIVPGGATNHFIIEIKVNSDYSTTFQRIDSIPDSSGGFTVLDAYDVDLTNTGQQNNIDILSMYDCVYNMNKKFSTYSVSPGVHGSSIVGQPGALEYVFCGQSKSLEMYNGAFIRSIAMPAGEAQLQRDGKNRIYAYCGNSIFRFSSDLLTKEEFPIKGIFSGYRQSAMVFKTMPGWVQIYSFTGKDLIGMRIPR
ncbi:MAG: hypothetical protein PHF97_12135 [Bacteroidales bacterium]|nr:hypothetical protein [Bacteroidales bacterium]MDD4604536.1 hypothetical protein [Bacteroidales bacterium]